MDILSFYTLPSRKNNKQEAGQTNSCSGRNTSSITIFQRSKKELMMVVVMMMIHFIISNVSNDIIVFLLIVHLRISLQYHLIKLHHKNFVECIQNVYINYEKIVRNANELNKGS